jgi:hypothetical protein
VYTVFLLETVQTALTGADVYYWFASGYGELNRLATPFASSIDVPIMESMVSAMVQFFYAYRVWILSNKSWRFCSFICLVGRSQMPFDRSHRMPPSSQFSALNAAMALTGGIHVSAFTFRVARILTHCRRLKKKQVCHG